MSDRSELLALIDQARYNPATVQRAMIDQVERTYKGELELIDPMNPFIFLLEASSVLGAAGMHQAETLTRRQYPTSALSMEELYLHMSDHDYLGRFASPAWTTISVLLGKEEVIKKAVPVGAGNVRKLTIPRHTRITVAETIFTMQYPIDVRVMAHGGIQIVYNNDKLSPIQTLESNKVDWSIQNYTLDHTDYIKIDIPVAQIRLESYVAALNATEAFKKSYTLNDQFYYCRAFMATAGGKWTEVLTTHSAQIYDPLTPTVVLKVIDGVLQVEVPQVYFNSGLMTTSIRLDIYTTKGPLEMPLSTYIANQFVAKWIDLDNDDGGVYVAPLEAMTSIAVFSDRVVTGGSNGLDFETLRKRVMNNSLGANELPITNNQVSSRMEDLGYSTVLYIDNLADRMFLATRALPLPVDGTLSSGAGATMATLLASFDELVELNTVIDNGLRLTLTPETLYLNTNGVISIVGNDSRQTLRALENETLADVVSANEYLYSPFHYVLDINKNTFEVRPYYIGRPEIVNRYFVEDNDTTTLGVNSANHEITRTANGWRLQILLDSSESFRALPDENVFIQLSFKASDEQDNAFINGRLIGKHPTTEERIYEFLIDTNWDIDDQHNLYLTNFTLYEPGAKTLPVSLTADFNLIYLVANYGEAGQAQSWIDMQKGHHLLPHNTLGVYMERLTVRLGDNLKGLWNRSRSIVGSMTYLTHAEDVPEVYEQNIYRRDATGGAVITMVDGNPEFELLHAKGDPVLDDEGNPSFRFRQGDLVLDEHHNPIPENPRGMLRQMELFMIDGVYYFATTGLDVTYRNSVPATLIRWLENDLRPMSKKLLEQTEMYLYPKSTIGNINVIVGDAKKTQIPAAQELVVTYYVTRAVYQDAKLKSAITQATVTVVAGIFKKAVVTRDELQSQLRTAMGNDIIALEIKGLGGLDDYTAISIIDDSARLCIGKKLTPMPDGTLAVQDAIDVAFIRHYDQ